MCFAALRIYCVAVAIASCQASQSQVCSRTTAVHVITLPTLLLRYILLLLSVLLLLVLPRLLLLLLLLAVAAMRCIVQHLMQSHCSVRNHTSICIFSTTCTTLGQCCQSAVRCTAILASYLTIQ
jgi:hypothetical protein